MTARIVWVLILLQVLQLVLTFVLTRLSYQRGQLAERIDWLQRELDRI